MLRDLLEDRVERPAVQNPLDATTPLEMTREIVQQLGKGRMPCPVHFIMLHEFILLCCSVIRSSCFSQVQGCDPLLDVTGQHA